MIRVLLSARWSFLFGAGQIPLLVTSLLLSHCIDVCQAAAPNLQAQDSNRSQPSSSDIETAWQHIELLNSPNFTKRRFARNKLNQMRERAYDALFEAQHHADTEIRLAVREILGNVQIQWTHKDDPEVILGIMKDFPKKNLHERKAIVSQLSRLDESWDCWVLVRIVRFDASEVISKWAALSLMKRSGSRSHSPQWQETLLTHVESSRRTAATWLQLYPSLVNNLPACVNSFETLVQQELTRVAQTKDKTKLDAIQTLALTRWFIEQKIEQLPPAESEALIDQIAWLVGSEEPAAKEHLDWLAMLQQWDAVCRWASVHNSQIETWAETQFRVAEAYRQQGDLKSAHNYGRLGLQSLPSIVEDRETIAHSLFAMNYPHWAIEVLISNLDDLQAGTEMDWRVRIDLALWLEDQCRWQEAAKILEDAIDAADSRDEGWNSVEQKETRNLIRSEHLRLKAIARIRSAPKETQEAAKLIDEALKLNPQGTHLLTLKWENESTRGNKPSDTLCQKIEIQMGRLEDQIQFIEQDLSRLTLPNEELRLKRELANQCVSLARLLCTTNGDMAHAKRLCEKALSHVSNEPEAYLTLALSLQNAGEFEKAIVAQKHAEVLRPRSIRVLRAGQQLAQLAGQPLDHKNQLR